MKKLENKKTKHLIVLYHRIQHSSRDSYRRTQSENPRKIDKKYIGWTEENDSRTVNQSIQVKLLHLSFFVANNITYYCSVLKNLPILVVGVECWQAPWHWTFSGNTM